MVFALATILVVSAVVFMIFAILPFDPAALTCGQRCNEQIIEANRIRLGLDKPLYEQYFLFISGIFLGRTYGAGSAAFSCPAPSFGYSFNENACVTDMITEALPITINLAVGALILWLTVGIGLGIVAAKFKNRWPDTGSSVFVLLGTSLPTFVTGLALLIWVTIKWKIIPLSLTGYTSLIDNPFKYFQYFILPWITLAIAYAALYTRFTRAALLETLGEDYIRTARAKGLPERTVIMRHAFRNAMIPIVTIVAFDVGGLIGGAIITERIFAWQGMGSLFNLGLQAVDLNLVMGVFLVTGIVAVLFNVVADIAYAALDPRIRLN